MRYLRLHWEARYRVPETRGRILPFEPPFWRASSCKLTTRTCEQFDMSAGWRELSLEHYLALSLIRPIFADTPDAVRSYSHLLIQTPVITRYDIAFALLLCLLSTSACHYHSF